MGVYESCNYISFKSMQAETLCLSPTSAIDNFRKGLYIFIHLVCKQVTRQDQRQGNLGTCSCRLYDATNYNTHAMLTSVIKSNAKPLKMFLNDISMTIYTHTFPHRATASSGPGPPHYRSFTITLRHTTLGRSSLD
jgi:hypothetical protein